ncbi:MAG: porin [Paracoccaceae bacterium]|nr:porin [Paracoccaceae bacterium]
MKKLLIATTALTLVAGAAAADVTVAGSGYFGLKYDGTAGRTTTLIDRTQLDFNMSKATDSGLKFHGHIRIRENDRQSIGVTGQGIGGGSVGVTAGGLDVTVGNVSDAIDAMALYYNSEIGICGCGGEVLNNGNFIGSSSQGAGNSGVLVTYTMGSFTVRASLQQPQGQVQNAKNETAISALYKAGALSVEGGYYDNQATGDKGYTVVAEYAIGKSNVGLAYGHSKLAASGNTVTLYGNTKMGATTLSAFVSNDSKGTNKTNYGIGAKYDLGSGAAMVGSVRKQQQNGKTYADLGVTFKF